MTGMPEAHLTPEGLIAVRTGGQEWTVLHPDGQCSYLLELSADAVRLVPEVAGLSATDGSWPARFHAASRVADGLGWGGTARSLYDLATQLNGIGDDGSTPDPEAARIAQAVGRALLAPPEAEDWPTMAPAPTYEEAREHFVDANERMGAALIEIGMALDLPRPTARYHWGQAEILAKIAELREAHPSDCIAKAEAAGIPVIAHEGATR